MSQVKLYWIRPDRQGSIHAGDYPSTEQALQAIPEQRRHLKSMCCCPEHEAQIDEGFWEVEGAL